MKTAKEMYYYCKTNELGFIEYKKWALKHFALIEKSLSEDEEAIMCFIGLHSSEGRCGYAITKKRIVFARKKLIGKFTQSVFLDNINDITFKSGMLYGSITIDTIKETLKISLEKKSAENINADIHNLLHELKQKKEATDADFVAELKKYKELLDAGVITQDEFDFQKRRLLH